MDCLRWAHQMDFRQILTYFLGIYSKQNNYNIFTKNYFSFADKVPSHHTGAVHLNFGVHSCHFGNHASFTSQADSA